MIFLKWKLKELYLRGIKNFYESLIIFVKLVFYERFIFKKIWEYTRFFQFNMWKDFEES